MKRIIVANKFYYNRGGDCIAAMALEDLLKAKGHPVAFFSMQHPQNFPSQWESYFPSEVCFGGGLSEKLKAVDRLFSSNEVKKKFNQLVDNFKPDVLHLNNIHSYLSPFIGELAHQKGIKVVWTLHDYKLVCPSYSCLRKGHPCTLCIDHNVSNVLSKKCMKNSLSASLMAYAEALYWNKKRIEKNTDTYIAPSSCMKKLMVKGGFEANKIKVIPNFTNREYPAIDTIPEKEEYYCYVGRLSEEKGIQTLVEVADTLPYKLVVVGTGPLKHLAEIHNKHIEYVGFKQWNEIQRIVQKAKFLVTPSECFEVFGLSNIESQCLGTPVLGANIGGIPETVETPSNGMLFESGNKNDLRDKINEMFGRSFYYERIAMETRVRFSADNYYNEIIKIYEQ